MHGCSMLMNLSHTVLTACLLHALLHHWPCTSTLTLLRLLAFKGSPLVPSPGRRTSTSYSPDMLTCMFESSRLPNRSGVGYSTSVATKHMLKHRYIIQIDIITLHDCIQQTKTLTSTVPYPTGMGPAVAYTWIESVCHTLHCEIITLEDFNGASVPSWSSQVIRFYRIPYTTWNTTCHGALYNS